MNEPSLVSTGPGVSSKCSRFKSQVEHTHPVGHGDHRANFVHMKPLCFEVGVDVDVLAGIAGKAIPLTTCKETECCHAFHANYVAKII
jgi:hypothetical protein